MLIKYNFHVQYFAMKIYKYLNLITYSENTEHQQHKPQVLNTDNTVNWTE